MCSHLSPHACVFLESLDIEQATFAEQSVRRVGRITGVMLCSKLFAEFLITNTICQNGACFVLGGVFRPFPTRAASKTSHDLSRIV